MQGIHTRIPETNHVTREYIVAAILSLLFMVPLCLVPALALLFIYVSTFRSMCAVPSMAVFCSSLTSWFPGMSLTYFLNYYYYCHYYYCCYYYYCHYYYYYYYYLTSATCFSPLRHLQRFHSSTTARRSRLLRSFSYEYDKINEHNA